MWSRSRKSDGRDKVMKTLRTYMPFFGCLSSLSSSSSCLAQSSSIYKHTYTHTHIFSKTAYHHFWKQTKASARSSDFPRFLFLLFVCSSSSSWDILCHQQQQPGQPATTAAAVYHTHRHTPCSSFVFLHHFFFASSFGHLVHQVVSLFGFSRLHFWFSQSSLSLSWAQIVISYLVLP